MVSVFPWDLIPATHGLAAMERKNRRPPPRTQRARSPAAPPRAPESSTAIRIQRDLRAVVWPQSICRQHSRHQTESLHQQPPQKPDLHAVTWAADIQVNLMKTPPRRKAIRNRLGQAQAGFEPAQVCKASGYSGPPSAATNAARSPRTKAGPSRISV